MIRRIALLASPIRKPKHWVRPRTPGLRRRVCRFTSCRFADLRPAYLPIYVRLDSSERTKSFDKTTLAAENCRDYLIYSILFLCNITTHHAHTYSHFAFLLFLPKPIDSSTVHPV
jgi:hypothetical protein